MQNFIDISLFTIIFLGVILIYSYFMIKVFLQMKRREIYKEGLKIFYEWKKEVYGGGSGVALKGIGEFYEKWLNIKINEVTPPNSKKSAN